MTSMRWGAWPVAALLAMAGCGGGPATLVEGDIAFVNANVLPMDAERVLEGRTVVIADGRIAAIGPSAEVGPADGVEIIDAAGGYLLPGLAEMHGHLPTPRMTDRDARNLLFLYIANGVTTVRGMQGHPSQFGLRARVDSGAVVGPRLLLGSVSINGRDVSTPEEAEQLVREYQVQGYDLIKMLEGVSVETYDAAVRTAAEVGIPLAGHVPDRVGLRRALAAGQASIDHLDNYIEALIPDDELPGEWPAIVGLGGLLASVDESRLPEVVNATVEAGAWVVPTMVLWETGIFAARPAADVEAERPEVRYMPPETVDGWRQSVAGSLARGDVETNRQIAELRRAVLLALYEGGANIALGTDSPQTFSVPGFSAHRELRYYVELGMTPYDALAIGTRKPAEYFGAAEEFGTVAVGRSADLILLTADPLADIANTERRAGVMVRGRWFPEDEIQRRLEEIAVFYGN